jgi:hypothetical protein
MKRIITLLSILALTSVTMTSCWFDEDDDIAYTLFGIWKGDMHTYFEDESGQYYQAFSTTLQFNTDGTGYELDEFSASPWGSYRYSPIRWTVVNRRIAINYLDDNSYYYINDYNLDDDYFEGYLDGEDGSSVEFRLVHVASFDWSQYSDNYYYSPAKPGSSVNGKLDTLQSIDKDSATKTVKPAYKRVIMK